MHKREVENPHDTHGVAIKECISGLFTAMGQVLEDFLVSTEMPSIFSSFLFLTMPNVMVSSNWISKEAVNYSS